MVYEPDSALILIWIHFMTDPECGIYKHELHKNRLQYSSRPVVPGHTRISAATSRSTGRGRLGERSMEGCRGRPWTRLPALLLACAAAAAVGECRVVHVGEEHRRSMLANGLGATPPMG